MVGAEEMMEVGGGEEEPGSYLIMKLSSPCEGGKDASKSSQLLGHPLLGNERTTYPCLCSS